MNHLTLKAQDVTEKLDRNIIKLSEAKIWFKKISNVSISARTKEAFIREMWKIVKTETA